MNYSEALSYLYSLGHETLAMKLELEAVRRLAAACGNPQQGFRAVHIAGTNGKGSTAAMIEAIARAAGHRTGLYTSPHLVSITERIRIDGAEIKEDEFAHLASRVREAAERLVAEGVLAFPPTFFEQVTMIGFLHFAERAVDLAVLEVGLGGRLDATNLCTPLATAITPVGFDHQQYLGNTLSAIAGEKAGIIKPGIPVVIAPQEDEAMSTILARARQLHAPVIDAQQEIHQAPLMQIEPANEDGGLFDAGRYRLRYRTARAEYEAALRLRGRHQTVNALVAIHLAEALDAAGTALPPAAVIRGLNSAEWPGRLEMIATSGAPLLLDGAHNPAGARALRDFLDTHCALVPVTVIFGAMQDKAIGEIGKILFPAARRVIATAIHNPRAAQPETIAETASAFNSGVICAADVKAALAEAQRTTPREGLICACGSLYLVGELKRVLRHNPPG